MVRTNVSADLISTTSEMGDTSNLAAILGATFLPKADAPVTIWLNFSLSCTANTNAVTDSAVNPSNAALSATSTFVTPSSLDAASLAYNNISNNM